MDNLTYRILRTAATWIILASAVTLSLSYGYEILRNSNVHFARISILGNARDNEDLQVKSTVTTKCDSDNQKLLTNPTIPAAQTSSTVLEIQQGDDDNYVAICMAVRAQSLDLPEFLTHHYHHLGIRHFYIQDDGTLPPLSTHIYPIPSSAITFTYYPRDKNHPNRSAKQKFQPFAYEECNRNFGHKHVWIAYLDADEFLEMVSIEIESGRRKTLQGFLRGFEGNDTIGAVAANWKVHTSSSHIHRQLSVRQSYTTCIVDTPKYDNRFIKSFVKTSKFESTINPHWFYLKGNSVTVGEEGDLIEEGLSWRTPVSRKRIAVHHFATKSREEFEEKVERGNAMGIGKQWGWWDFLHALPEVRCEEMVGYVP